MNIIKSNQWIKPMLALAASGFLLLAFMPTALAAENETKVVKCKDEKSKDRPAIQTAINDLDNSTVVLEGHCKLDGETVIISRSNLVVKGERSGDEYLTTVEGEGEADRGFAITAPGPDQTVKNVTIKDIHFDSFARTVSIEPEVTFCYEGGKAENIIVRDNLITNSQRGPQIFGGTSDSKFINNTMTDYNGAATGLGFFAAGAGKESSCEFLTGPSSNILIEGANVSGAFRVGGWIQVCENCTVKDSTVSIVNNGNFFDHYGIILEDSEGITAKDNFVQGDENAGAYVGIFLGTQDGMVEDNIVDGTHAGILMEGDGTGSVVQNNTLRNIQTFTGFCGEAHPDLLAITVGWCFNPSTENWTLHNNQIESVNPDDLDVLFAESSSKNTYEYDDADQVILNKGMANKCILEDGDEGNECPPNTND